LIAPRYPNTSTRYILDDGVGEQLLGRRLQRSLRRHPVGALDLDIETLALPHAAERPKTPSDFNAPFDRLALGSRNAGISRKQVTRAFMSG